MLKAWLAALLGLLYPECCPECRRAVAAGSGWCPECLAAILAFRTLRPAPTAFCALESCWATTAYTGTVRRLIREMKFRRTDRPARFLTELVTLGTNLNDPGGWQSFDAVVPVPLHRDRQRERGFNQTERIFQPWCRERQIPWRPVLERIRTTQPQWELGLEERRKNIIGAFVVTRPETLHRQKILLVDDICTSGTTLEACAQALKNAGASRVAGLVVASGVGLSPGSQ